MHFFSVPASYFSYSEGTKPEDETVTFSGTVILEGQTDQSEVTIALYKPVAPDIVLARINQQYPNIGVWHKATSSGQISQETEFNHRAHTPVATTVSDIDGNWRIGNVKSGEHHIVVSKRKGIY